MEKNKLGIIIFSRMSSSRLPGKALIPLGGIPLIERVIKRAKLTEYNVFLATSCNAEDDVLEDIALNNQINCYRGSLNNVLERGVKAAQHFGLKAFARLCGDRPLFSIDEICKSLNFYSEMDERNPLLPDIITNFITGYKIKGLTTEVVLTNSLKRILEQSINDGHREHLTSYIYQNLKDFNILNMAAQFQRPILDCYAVDDQSEFDRLDAVFNINSSVDLTIQEADFIYQRFNSI